MHFVHNLFSPPASARLANADITYSYCISERLKWSLIRQWSVFIITQLLSQSRWVNILNISESWLFYHSSQAKITSLYGMKVVFTGITGRFGMNNMGVCDEWSWTSRKTEVETQGRSASQKVNSFIIPTDLKKSSSDVSIKAGEKKNTELRMEYGNIGHFCKNHWNLKTIRTVRFRRRKNEPVPTYI